MTGLKEIPGHSGYFITAEGEVFSNKMGALRALTQHLNEKGYLRVCLTKGLKKRVHRLVMETFSDSYNNRLQVNHIDGCKTNNTLTNLEMVTDTENKEHAVNLGLCERKLTTHTANEIRLSGEGNKVLMDKYKVSRRTIYDIKNDKTWKTCGILPG
jgi:hypothetical protein